MMMDRNKCSLNEISPPFKHKMGGWKRERKRDILYLLLDCNSLPSARSISFLLEMEAASGFHGNLVVGGLQAP